MGATVPGTVMQEVALSAPKNIILSDRHKQKGKQKITKMQSFTQGHKKSMAQLLAKFTSPVFKTSAKIIYLIFLRTLGTQHRYKT